MAEFFPWLCWNVLPRISGWLQSFAPHLASGSDLYFRSLLFQPVLKLTFFFYHDTVAHIINSCFQCHFCHLFVLLDIFLDFHLSTACNISLRGVRRTAVSRSEDWKRCPTFQHKQANYGYVAIETLVTIKDTTYCTYVSSKCWWWDLSTKIQILLQKMTEKNEAWNTNWIPD